MRSIGRYLKTFHFETIENQAKISFVWQNHSTVQQNASLQFSIEMRLKIIKIRLFSFFMTAFIKTGTTAYTVKKIGDDLKEVKTNLRFFGLS